MKSKAISIVLALIMLSVATGVFAKGQPKTDVCHLDDEGNYKLINIANPALSSHLAHGDKVVGVDVDENCEPLSVEQTGCFAFRAGEYILADGSTVQGTPLLYNSTCLNIPFTAYAGNVIWAWTQGAAQLLCASTVQPTLTTNLWACPTVIPPRPPLP